MSIESRPCRRPAGGLQEEAEGGLVLRPLRDGDKVQGAAHGLGPQGVYLF